LNIDHPYQGLPVGSGYVLYIENDDGETGDYLYFKDSQQIARYRLAFDSSFRSRITDANGVLDASGGWLRDYQGKSLEILGKNYTIVRARSAIQNHPESVELILMEDGILDEVTEGNSKSYSSLLGGISLKVESITDAGTPFVVFSVNNSLLAAMRPGDISKLSNGMYLGLMGVIYNEAGDVTDDSASLFLGKHLISLNDTTILDNAGQKALKIDGDVINEDIVSIQGTYSGTTVSINDIFVNMSAGDDYYVPAGGLLSNTIIAQSDNPNLLFTRNWDILYTGLDNVDFEEISIKTSGKDKYKLAFMDWGGNLVQAPLAYASAASVLKMGDDDDDFIINESRNISKDDYFIITDATKDAGERPTYLLRYKGADKSTDENPKFKIENVGSKETLEKTYTAAGGSATATFNIGGGSYKVENHEAITSNDFSIKVDLDGDGTINESNAVSITTRAGAQIAIAGNQTGGAATIDLADKLTVTISTPDSDDYEDLTPANIQYNISATSDTEVDLTKLDVYSLVTPDDEDNVQYGYNSLGAFIKYTNPSSDPDELIIDYPEAQRLPQVYITSGASSSSGGVGAGSENVNINKIEVGAAKLDKDVSSADLAANNVLSIGGSCVNAISAEIMGLEAGTCGAASGIPQNKALIKLFENGEKVSMVIAGWTAEDTQRASRVLANYEDYALSGMEVEVTGTSLSDISVGAPSPVMEEEEAPAEDEAAE